MPDDKSAPLLDIGSGYGQFLAALDNLGFGCAEGVDICSAAVESARRRGLRVTLIRNLAEWIATACTRYELIIMNHVLEHLPKDQIIETLRTIRQDLLTSTGRLNVATPNAQSDSGCYWAYEDFTHSTSFSAGSLMYVLRAAGYRRMELIDPDGTKYVAGWKRVLKLGLLRLYRTFKGASFRITGSSHHRASPEELGWKVRMWAQ